MRIGLSLLLSVLLLAPALRGAQGGTVDDARAGYDLLLDTYVRDGLVYYRALRSDRARLDRFVSALGTSSLEGVSRDERIAFWVNAYNALVLKTVIDHYPIARRSREYPARSIRQIPGAFERTPRRVAGRTLTLDQIEQTVLAPFEDPRVFLALGRGAVGSGRLRSEAYTAANLDRQLSEVAAECVHRSGCIDLEPGANLLKVSSIFSWREREFTQAFADRAESRFSARSPIERAVLAFIGPKLLTTEREFIEPNQFQLRYIPFDWTLNELSAH
ncbi:MAG: DUF547 domain-containing protein [Vicinamibacterales bacterium]